MAPARLSKFVAHSAALACLCVAATAAAAPKARTKRVVFLLDSSSSMQQESIPCDKEGFMDELAGRYADRFSQARQVLDKLTHEYADKGYQMGLVAFGHSVKASQSPLREEVCNDIGTLVPIGWSKGREIRVKSGTISPSGGTPLAAAMLKAAKEFGEGSASDDELVVITDGEESCNGNPVEAARELYAKYKVSIHLIGINLCGGTADQAKHIAEAGKGTFRHDRADAPPEKLGDMPPLPPPPRVIDKHPTHDAGPLLPDLTPPQPDGEVPAQSPIPRR